MPRLVILHPHGQGRGETGGLTVLHVTSLAFLLGRRGWDVEAADLLDPRLSDLVQTADLVLVQMLADPEVEAAIRWRRRLGLPTVYEIIDNVLAVTDWASRSHRWASPLVRQSLMFHASIADALQVPTPGLAEMFSGLNERVFHFDPYTPLPERLPAKPGGFVLGWAGTQTYAEEMRAIAPAVTAFCARHPDVTFAYMGAERVFRESYGGIAPERTVVHPFGEQAEYLEFVRGLHVGLVPRRPSAFNAVRTDWKFAILAANGTAGVIEDGPAHRPHRERARLYRTPAELEALLEELYADPEQVSRLARSARAWALAERNADVLADQREQAYRPLLAPQPPDVAPPPAADPAPSARLAELLRLDPGQALEGARELAAGHPAYEQAHLLVARSLARLGRDEEALAYVEELVPSPVFADCFADVQVRCARRSRRRDADRFARRIDSPFKRARLTATGSVLDCARAVLEHQPYDHFALAGAIRLLGREDPGSPELEELFERASYVAPEDVPADRRPARLAGYLPG